MLLLYEYAKSCMEEVDALRLFTDEAQKDVSLRTSMIFDER